MKMGAGTAALGAVGSLSGCSAIRDLVPGGGGGLGKFTNWVYEPDTFESDQERLNNDAVSYKSMLSNKGKLNDFRRLSILGTDYPKLGIDVEDVGMELNLPEGRVITGSFDTETVKTELTASQPSTPTAPAQNMGGSVGSTEYESDGTYNDYEIFVQSEPDESPDAVALGDGTIVDARRAANRTNDSDPVGAPDVAEGIIDTGTNGDDRLVDGDDTFKTLTDKLNSGARVNFELLENPVGSDDGGNENIPTSDFDGLVASGRSVSINGGTTKFQWVFVYDSEGDVNESDVNEWVEANNTGDGSLSNVNNITVNTNSNTATVTGKQPTFEY
ncbi:hypothetical protein [Haloarcula onubensis]|uniref:Uncharacterized protein n=1 Tax=Haloarcula onubensis TaxID=2950539 RepID=A0ABU2FR46_9EURY|nr:hypothetical protein [Halomicroarcula sp. S3CR25-11]MDS0283240.1 hypothetical protein [Halomicroarcula sp. S3CR25-11]